MEVNFNNLRIAIISDYNALVKKVRNTDHFPEEAYDLILPTLQDLRKGIVTLACCYDDESGIVSLADTKILVP
jgi:hypothetical protein